MRLIAWYPLTCLAAWSCGVLIGWWLNLRPEKKLRILKPVGSDEQKFRVGTLVQVSMKSVCKNPVKIGPEVRHFSQYQQYFNM